MDVKIDWADVRKRIDAVPWEPCYDIYEEQDGEVRTVFLGNICNLVPSGKYYTPYAHSNIDSEEAQVDEAWWLAAEEEAAEQGFALGSSEGDGTDVLVYEYK